MDLMTISLTDSSYQIIRDLKRTQPSLANDIQKIARNAIDEVSLLALKGYKSKSPIDTAEFRGTNLDNGYITRSRPSNLANAHIQASIFVIETTHLGRDKKPISSTTLAGLLNIGQGKKGPLRRTQTSAAIDSFGAEPRRSPTKDWILKAESAIKKQLPSFLNSRNFNY